MALAECLKCSTLFAVGVDSCPHCGAADHREFGATPDTFNVNTARKKELLAEAERRNVEASKAMTVKELRGLLS